MTRVPAGPEMPLLSRLLSPPSGPACTAGVLVVAQGGGDGAGPADGMRSIVQMLPIALVLVAAYFLLFRPEREKVRRQQELLASLKKNDQVVTASGLYGTVSSVDRERERVTLRIDDTARVTVTLASIARIIGDRGGDADGPSTKRDEA